MGILIASITQAPLGGRTVEPLPTVWEIKGYESKACFTGLTSRRSYEAEGESFLPRPSSRVEGRCAMVL